MSLQTCHCGWSRVTTYQGLRIHQGRMGCTPARVRIAEPEQKYFQGVAEHLDVQMNFKLDVHASVKTENTYYDSDLSLHVCHCGWNKVTTYRGLRIHQGKMGCTPLGVRIPRTEQKYWRDYWKQEVDPRKHPPAKRGVIKPENFPASPRMGRSINSAAAAAAAIKEEHKSPPALPPRSSIHPHHHHQLEELSPRPQVSDAVRAAANPSVVRAKTKITKSQTLPQNTNQKWIKDYQTDSCDNYPTAAGRIKEPVSPYAIPKVSTKSKSLKPKDERLDSSSNMQTKRFQGRDHQATSSVLRRQKDGRDQTSARVNQPIKEQPSAPPVVPIKKKEPPLAERQEGYKSQPLQGIQNWIDESNKTRKEKNRGIKPTEPAYQNVVESQRSSLSSIKTAAAMEENKSPYKTPQESLKEPRNTNPAAAEQMSSSVRKHLKAPPVVPPKKKNSLWSTVKPENSGGSSAAATQEKEKLEQKVVLSRSIDAPEAATFEENQSAGKTQTESLKNPTNTKAAAAGEENRKPPVPPKKKIPPLFVAELKKSESAADTENLNYLQGQNKKREEEINDVKPVETRCEIIADVTRTNNHTAAAAAAGIPPEDPTSVSTEQPDINTGSRTVKNLAKMFSVITNEDKAARPKAEEVKHSQVKRFAQCLPAIKTQQPTIQPTKEKQELMQRATETPIPQKASAAAELKEAPASSFKAAESGFSTRMKVRELARRFSLQETAAQLKGKLDHGERKPSQLPSQWRANREELKLTQKLSDSSGAVIKSDPAEHEASGFSSGLKVKDLVRRFSAG